MDASPRQTASYLRNLLQENRLRPKNKLGQNFLIDLNLMDVILRRAELTPADLVLEVGTGTGGLTSRLAREAGAVLSIEIDHDFHALAQHNLAGLPNVTLLRGDALHNKNRLNPRLFEELHRLRQELQPQNVKLIANLPYAVATPVISNLLLSDVPIERMVVMVQLEIAERFQASPSTKDYSALSVLVQSLARVEVVRRLPPEVFWPRPKVDSAIVCIVPDASKRAEVADVHQFRHFLRDLYAHRRKNLRGALLSLPGERREKPWVDAKLAELGYLGTERAESLSVAQHLQLCEAFHRE